MRLIIVLAVVLLILPGVGFSAKVDAFFMTFSAPGSSPCMILRTSLPLSTSVQTTAARVYFFYLVSDIRSGDSVSTRYFKPGGAPYPNIGANHPAYTRATPFGCWWDTVSVAGTDLAKSPGVWKATVLVNGNILSSLNFTVVGPTSSSIPPVTLPPTLPPTTIAPPVGSGCNSVLTITYESGKRFELAAKDVASITFEPSRNSEYVIGRAGTRADGIVDIFATTMVIRMLSGVTYRKELGPWAERPPSNPKIDFRCENTPR